ncbi:MAG: Gfo/Idh/MocA family oxidoreductase [Candidatus Nealsonbacteria bacterium]
MEKTIIIGYGNVGKMHARIFSGKVEVIGVVDPDQAKRQKARQDGFTAFESISAISQAILVQTIDPSFFWDICVPDENHLAVTQELLKIGAARILIEKPICMPSQVGQMRTLLKTYPEVEICVEETYLASNVLSVVNEMASEHGLAHPRIYIEQTKNRIEDIEKGRFTDPELMIFGLEAPHCLTLVTGTGSKRRPAEIKKVILNSMTLPDSRVLAGQGLGRIDFSTEDGCEVILYTSMEGKIGRPLPEVQAPDVIPYKDSRRYRILVLEERDVMIIGQSEPIPGWERFKGRVLVFKKGQKLEEVVVEDSPMNKMLMWAIEFFRGERENPSPPETALLLVEFLGEAVKFSN